MNEIVFSKWQQCLSLPFVYYTCLQALCYFYYFIPFYIAALCALVYPGQLWIKDWSLVHAGASMQAQLVYICSSLKWRTAIDFQVPDTVIARSIFWTVNLSLVIIPHLFALYCHRLEIREFLSRKMISPRKSIHGKRMPSQTSTKKINDTWSGPVTRQHKKLL